MCEGVRDRERERERERMNVLSREWFHIFWSLGYVLFTATTSSVTLLFPAILLRLFSVPLYSRATSAIFSCWWTSCLFITERLNGVKVRVTGDSLPLGVPLLIMSNHKCNLDWMFLWSAAIRTGSLWHVGVFRAVAKSEIRVVPIFGWGCKLNGFAYVARKWARDAAHLKRWMTSQMSHGRTIPGWTSPGWTLIFPEGTRFTEANKKRSDASAVKDGLETLPGEILRPRTKGLALLLAESSMRGGGGGGGGGGDGYYFNAVVDMTVAYTDADGKPLKGSALGTRCFGQLAKGELPVDTCHVHFECFHPKDVPTDPEKVDAWCMERWRKKADILEGVAKTGRVSGFDAWSSSGGSVPFVLQTFLRIAFTAQGLACVGLIVSYKLFAAYAAVALFCLGVIAHVDSPEW